MTLLFGAVLFIAGCICGFIIAALCAASAINDRHQMEAAKNRAIFEDAEEDL